MVIIQKLPVVVHQLFFFAAQLLILKIHGIEYSGSLAFIGAVSTIFAVIISLKWDIEIMVSNLKTLPECILNASITVTLMTIIISFVNFALGFPVSFLLILSGLIIAIHEILVSILFVQKKIYRYSFARSIPAILLVYLSMIGYSPEVIWPASFLFSISILFFYFGSLFKEAVHMISINKLQNITLSKNIYAALTACFLTFFSGFFVVIIRYYFDDEYVGLWSNTLRIFNSIFVFVIGGFLPFLLVSFRDQPLISEKIKRFFYFWVLFLPFILLFFFGIENIGVFTLSKFMVFDFDLTGPHLSQIFLAGIGISFISSAQGLYQAINKSLTLLIMIAVTMAAGTLLVLNTVVSFIAFLQIFLLLTIALSGMIFMHLIYCVVSESK